MGLRECGHHVAAYARKALPGEDEFVIEEEGDRYDVYYTGGDGDYRQHVGMAETWRDAVTVKRSRESLASWELAEFLDGSYDPDAAEDDLEPEYVERNEI
jgi:hypothetical protein